MNKHRSMILAALFAAINIAVSSVAFITNFVPFQHATNVVGAVFLGPTYNFAQAMISATVRCLFLGRPFTAYTGAVIGAVLAAVCYKKSRALLAAAAGEVVGTGIIGALLSYLPMKYLFIFPGMNLAREPFWFFVPLWVPATITGGIVGVLLAKALLHSGLKPFDDPRR
ncbi:energy coupling factor transporter S component ThiW [Peptoniphilus equinus]|uniref:Energy coupling factor transporter S component ThiW n=1 Tax=Peptoniphilus equinus TaxID=3016343 RepID=A0ABY7QTJ4_9FIRM|nr:energy coupling factor transporter S component ThiW [Peptoniphilus equinus]WBW49781.1 energy coupling factor transporter S component ThiW [Peptoniphilus equinus]